MQDSIRAQLGAAVNTAETTSFCLFFFFFLINSELKENKKNLLKKKFPWNQNKEVKNTQIPIPKKKTHYNYSCAYSLLGEGIYERSVGGVQCR